LATMMREMQQCTCVGRGEISKFSFVMM